MGIVRRLISPIVELRESETGTALMMFAYSFLAMTAYNIVQPITRSRFISSLGADNLPYVLLVSVFIVGAIMQGYSRLGGLLPRQVGRAGHAGRDGRRCSSRSGSLSDWGWTSVDVGFYLFGQILRDPAHQPVLDAGQHHLRPAAGQAAVRVHRRRREPRRRSPAAASRSLLARTVGNANLMLVSAAMLALSARCVVSLIVAARAQHDLAGLEEAGKEEGVSSGEALQMLRRQPAPADHRARDRL